MNKLKIATLALLTWIIAFGPQAGTLAQDNGLVVTITRVDSHAFPLVTAYLAVMDEEGLPVIGLTREDFRVAEDAMSPAEPIAVESNTSQGIGLVLALDISVADDTLVEIKGAVRSLLLSMGPQDQVAVITFSDQVQVIQGFASPQETLQSIDSLTTGGSYTALNQAALDAAELSGESPLARTAVVVLLDSADNRGILAFAETLDQVQQAHVPFHVVGYGPKMKRPEAQDLEALASATGGQSALLTNAQDVRASLQTTSVVLHQGYRVTFRSRLQADGADHDFDVSIASLGREGRAESHYTATSGDVIVDLPGLADGQKVGGMVSLSAAVTAPAPVASVEYRLDGQALVKTNDPPYSFAWNSTDVEPGMHTLTARAVDRAGNKGEVSVRLNIATPIAITQITVPDQVGPGEEIVAEARIEALLDIVRVGFVLDGGLVGSGESVDGSLYRFSFDSGQFSPGEHILTVRAEDTLGRIDSASANTVFLPPPTPTPTPVPTPVPTPEPEPEQPEWPRSLVSGGTAAISAAAAIVLTALTARTRRRRRRKLLPLAIRNVGNTRSHYELRAESPDNDLTFQWMLNGELLAQRQVAEEMPGAKDAAGQVDQEDERPSPISLAKQPAGVRQKAAAALRFGTTVAAFLDTLYRLLPRSVGGPLLRASRRLRSGQSKVRRVERTSSRISRKVSRAPSTRTTAPARLGPQRTAPQAVFSTWNQTPCVEPGETLTVDLLIDPAKPHRARQSVFKVISRSAEQQDAPLMIHQHSFQIAGMSWVRRLLPYVLFFGGAATVSLIVFWLANTGTLGL